MMAGSSVREIRFSSKHSVELQDYPIADIDRDSVFTNIFEKARVYSMTNKEVMYSLYLAVRYAIENKIPGDFVECGVWRGGSALLAALTFREFGDANRVIRLYDTFEGMTKPSEEDIDIEGEAASDYIERFGDAGHWCYENVDAVRSVFFKHGIEKNVQFIVGDVLNTLLTDVPESVSVLRLDTDWYASTKAELEVLYPRLVTGGVVIIDDYGHWNGARAAVDEYFSDRPRPLLQRTTYAVRTGIKI